MTFNPDHVRYTLAAAGFHLTDEEIESIEAQLKQAIADGTVKQSTVPDRNRYPIGFMLSLAVGRDISKNYQRYIEKAVRIYPPIQGYVVSASYTQVERYKKEYKRNRTAIGVASLTLEGAIAFAAVLRHDPKKTPAIIPMSGINRDADLVLSQLASVRNLCSTSSAKTCSTLANVRQLLKDSTPPIPADRPFMVYALRDRSNSVVKIGVTDNLEACLKVYKSDNPWLVPIAFFPVDSIDTEKKYLQPSEVGRSTARPVGLMILPKCCKNWALIS